MKLNKKEIKDIESIQEFNEKYTEEIETEFNNLIGKLTDKQFWSYVSGWYDEQEILNIMNNWEIETKKEAIKELKEILKRK